MACTFFSKCVAVLASLSAFGFQIAQASVNIVDLTLSSSNPNFELQTFENFTCSYNFNPSAAAGLSEDQVPQFELTWSKNGKPLTTFSSIDNYDAVPYFNSEYLEQASSVEFVLDQEKRESAIKFNSVSIEDAGEFTCTIKLLKSQLHSSVDSPLATISSYFYASQSQAVAVYKAPMVSVSIENGGEFDTRPNSSGPHELEETQYTIGTCSVKGAYPEPTAIEVSIGNRAPIHIESSVFTSVQNNVTNLYSISDQVLSANLQGQNDDGAGVSCRAVSDYYSVVSESTPEDFLTVLWLPVQASINFITSEDEIIHYALENEVVKVNCDAPSNPSSIVELSVYVPPVEEADIPTPTNNTSDSTVPTRRRRHEDHDQKVVPEAESTEDIFESDNIAADTLSLPDETESEENTPKVSMMLDTELDVELNVELAPEVDPELTMMDDEDVTLSEAPEVDVVSEIYDTEEIYDYDTTMGAPDQNISVSIIDPTAAPAESVSSLVFTAVKGVAHAYQCSAKSHDPLYSYFKLDSKVTTIEVVYISSVSLAIPEGVQAEGTVLDFNCQVGDHYLGGEDNAVLYSLYHQADEDEEFALVGDGTFVNVFKITASMEGSGSYKCSAQGAEGSRVGEVFSESSVLEVSSPCGVDGDITISIKKSKPGEKIMSTLTCPVTGDGCKAAWIYDREYFGLGRKTANQIIFNNLKAYPQDNKHKKIKCLAVNGMDRSMLAALPHGKITPPPEESNSLLYIIIAVIVLVVIFVAYKKKQGAKNHKKKQADKEGESLTASKP